jgi:hypothetical protein
LRSVIVGKQSIVRLSYAYLGLSQKAVNHANLLQGQARRPRAEGIASTKSSFALKQVKYKTAPPLDHLEEG